MGFDSPSCFQVLSLNIDYVTFFYHLFSFSTPNNILFLLTFAIWIMYSIQNVRWTFLNESYSQTTTSLFTIMRLRVIYLVFII